MSKGMVLPHYNTKSFLSFLQLFNCYTLQRENSCNGAAKLCSLFLIAECRVSLQMAQRVTESTVEKDWNELCRFNMKNNDKTGRLFNVSQGCKIMVPCICV